MGKLSIRIKIVFHTSNSARSHWKSRSRHPINIYTCLYLHSCDLGKISSIKLSTYTYILRNNFSASLELSEGCFGSLVRLFPYHFILIMHNILLIKLLRTCRVKNSAIGMEPRVQVIDWLSSCLPFLLSF